MGIFCCISKRPSSESTSLNIQLPPGHTIKFPLRVEVHQAFMWVVCGRTPVVLLCGPAAHPLSDLSHVLPVFPAGEHVGEGERLQAGVDQVWLLRLLFILLCRRKLVRACLDLVKILHTTGFCRGRAVRLFATRGLPDKAVGDFFFWNQLCINCTDCTLHWDLFCVRHLCNTAGRFPWRTSCRHPSGCGPSRCSRCPGATSPATGTPRGSCPPGTALQEGGC